MAWLVDFFQTGIVIPMPIRTLGGAAFVQLITALNLGLVSISQLKTAVEWLWKRIRDYRDSMLAEAKGKLAQFELDPKFNAQELDHIRATIAKLESFLKLQEPRAARAQRIIWNICRCLAVLCFIEGCFHLYFDWYRPWTAWLVLPYPLYWLASAVALVCFKLGAKRITKSTMALIQQPSSPGPAIDQAIDDMQSG